jgi:hypothetical protein
MQGQVNGLGLIDAQVICQALARGAGDAGCTVHQPVVECDLVDGASSGHGVASKLDILKIANIGAPVKGLLIIASPISTTPSYQPKLLNPANINQ